jgi:hypothetical protein
MSICEEPEQSTYLVHLTSTLKEDGDREQTRLDELSVNTILNLYFCPVINGSFEKSAIEKELSGFFVNVAKPTGGVVPPLDVKVAITVEVFAPKQAERWSVVDSVM